MDVAKRSPILGYNHNIRHRGIVFHVQTEDSGVANPHLFTHLFHGGVIISSRRLDYDAGSAEEAVKGLMQAQHKAVLKDLKAGSFDDKIDAYLGGTPGLEPAPERRSRDTLITPAPPVVEPEISGPAGSTLGEAVRNRLPADSEPPRPAPSTATTQPLPPRIPTEAPPARTAPPPLRDAAQLPGDEVSAAFRAIGADEVPDLDRDAVPVATEDDGETTPVPMSFDEFVDGRVQPVGARPGSPSRPPPTPPAEAIPRMVRPTPSGIYAEHGKGRTDIVAVGDRTIPNRQPPPQRAQRPSASGAPTSRPHTPSQPPAKPPRANTVPPPIPRVAIPPSTPPPMGSARAPVRPQGSAQTSAQAPRRAPAVVVSRPAVIVGGPPKVVGGGRNPDMSAKSSRRAREEVRGGNMFGKDLISEKSLDEVILAYLSEDSPDE